MQVQVRKKNKEQSSGLPLRLCLFVLHDQLDRQGFTLILWGSKRARNEERWFVAKTEGSGFLKNPLPCADGTHFLNAAADK